MQQNQSQVVDHSLPPAVPSISLAEGDQAVTVDQQDKHKPGKTPHGIKAVWWLGACLPVAFALGMLVSSNELRENAYIAMIHILHQIALAISVLLDTTVRNDEFRQNMLDSITMYILYKLIDTSLHVLKRWRRKSKKEK